MHSRFVGLVRLLAQPMLGQEAVGIFDMFVRGVHGSVRHAYRRLFSLACLARVTTVHSPL